MFMLVSAPIRIVAPSGQWAGPTPHRSLGLGNVDSHWAATSDWTEDSGDLGDAEEFEDGDGPLSDDDGSDDDEC